MLGQCWQTTARLGDHCQCWPDIRLLSGHTGSIQLKLPQGLSPGIGVKQGYVLSPTLSNMFINGLPDLFVDTDDPAQLYNTKVHCLLYADDRICVSTSANGLKTCLSKLDSYCQKWKLAVNIDESKVMTFNKSGRKIKSNVSI